jgi:GrpB-like predicted nucleotidyltransferase (UPF0157 family)
VIEIVPYEDRWPGEFAEIGRRLRAVLGDAALRIDHIGSTSVPGLAAKDVIDVQVSVLDLDAALGLLTRAGFVSRAENMRDHMPPGMDLPDHDLEKRMVEPPAGERQAHIHVRVEGRFNQRYPLIFRDYLRTHPEAAAAVGETKSALARHVGGDVDAYYDVKDPAYDILMASATLWALAEGWSPAPSDA